MNIHYNVLSDKLLEDIETEIIKNFNNACWRVGGLAWHKGLKQGLTGEVLQTPASDLLAEKIAIELKDIIPTQNIKTNFCLYSKGAGLSIHNDEGWSWAATIYLNKEWDPNNGGILLYTEDNQHWKAIFPRFNTMVVNTQKEQHMVTPVSMLAEEYRASIQIWGV